ncbi:hypothetical protein Fcan01_08855 [Folsomia candida]|uniref:Transposase domain-containing protein n=1 Tax=Folsomia candida TaxID=158441 RepID=A0A226EEY3_FOLCA|nr:hypothetical protein Fcan01_08855 [Folsomia candida]
MRKTILGKRRLQQIAKEEARQQYQHSEHFQPEPEVYEVNIDQCDEVQHFTSSDDEQHDHVDSETDYHTVNSVLPPESHSVPTPEEFSVLEALKSWSVKFKVNNAQFTSLLKILKVHACFEKFPSDCRNLLVVRDKPTIKPMPPGEFVYFGLQRQINLINAPKELSLQINIDGFPLFKSSSQQFWPILGSFVGISKTPFVIAIFGGKKKPELSDHMLEEFVEEFNRINNSSVYNIKFHSIVCDAPARSFVKGVKGHTGYHGCDRCDVEGENIEHCMTFCSEVKNLRSNQTFRNRQDEDDHVRETVLKNIPSLDLVLGFPQDYMHLICLGVVKKLLHLWISGKASHEKLRASEISLISDRLDNLKNKVLCQFSRKPRSLDDLARYKATEFRQFLLYTGPVVLRNVVSPDSYQLFICHFPLQSGYLHQKNFI